MGQALREQLAQIPDVEESASAFKQNLAFWVNGKEIAHFESPTVIDIRLTRGEISRMRSQLNGDSRVTLRRSGSDWLSVKVDDAGDHAFVLELVEIATAAHRAAPGTIPEAPPSGAELDRRRRFH